MSEYIINGTLLTNIADAVRSIDGSTSTLTPQQMETRLKAIKSSIDSALSALTAKEVEVPSDSTIHRLAELITSIEAGSIELNISTGTFTMANTANSYGQYFYGGIGTIDDLGVTVQHSLGVIPKICVLMCETRPLLSTRVDTIESALYYENGGKCFQLIQGLYSSNNSNTWLTSNISNTLEKTKLTADTVGCFLNATESEIFITSGSNIAGCALCEAYTYKWMIAG